MAESTESILAEITDRSFCPLLFGDYGNHCVHSDDDEVQDENCQGNWGDCKYLPKNYQCDRLKSR